MVTEPDKTEQAQQCKKTKKKKKKQKQKQKKNNKKQQQQQQKKTFDFYKLHVWSYKYKLHNHALHILYFILLY